MRWRNWTSSVFWVVSMMSDQKNKMVPIPEAPPRANNNMLSADGKVLPMGITVQAMQELTTLGSDNPRMPESIFQNFLQALYNPETKSLNMSLWYKTFNGYRQGVDIVDEEGEVKFVCPPPVGTVQTVIAARKTESFSQIAENAAVAEKRHVLLGQKTLKEGLEQHGLPSIHPVHRRWVAILMKYDLMKAEEPSSNGRTVTEDSFNPLAGDDEPL